MTLFDYDPQFWWYMLPGSAKFLAFIIAVLFLSIRREIKHDRK